MWLAVRQRNAGVRRDAQRRGDAGNDFERHAGLGQRFGLLAAASEQERIAALQTDHVPATPRAVDEHGADLVLRVHAIGFLLADVDALGVGGGESEQRRGSQVVEEHGIGGFEQAAALDGDEIGIARAGAHQVDLSHKSWLCKAGWQPAAGW